METKVIPGYSKYALSKCGRLFKTFDHSEVEVFIGKNGYRQAWIWRGKKCLKHPKLIYRLMAKTFLPPKPSDKHLVRHLDGNPHNDSVDNLAWGTHKQNMQDLRKHNKQRASLSNELKSEIMKAVKKSGKTVEQRRKLAEMFNVGFTTVDRIHWKIEDAKRKRSSRS